MKNVAAQTFNIIGGLSLGIGSVAMIVIVLTLLISCTCCFGLLALGSVDMDLNTMDFIATPQP